MKKPSKGMAQDENTFARLIGLGEDSLQKSYYPKLQKKIKELEKSEHLYRLLAENTSDVIWMLDLEGSILFTSPSVERMTGFSPEELMGKPFQDGLTKDSEKKFQDAMEEAVQNQDSRPQEPAKEIELQQTVKDGSPKWVSIVLSVFYSDLDKSSRILCIARDISERRKAEQTRQRIQEQLLQAQKMESIGTLAGGIAHDFNNLLTIINGYADLVLMQTEKSHPLYSEINAIQQAGRRAEDLTRQLLGFSRKQIYKPVMIDINRTISSIDTLLRRLIDEDIHIETILDTTISPISADRSQIEQIFTNLVINARDAVKMMDTENFQKKITIETGQTRLGSEAIAKLGLQEPGPYIFFSVSDNGKGFDNSIKERLFEPFFTTKPKHEGTGLGLSMIYGIVKQNNGSIQVYSEPEEGAMFKIYWPASKRTGAPATEKSRTGPLPSGNETILVVEDDKEVCRFAAKCLQSLGYQVLTAYNGRKALEKIIKEALTPDLIITDLVMPEINGRDFIKQAISIRPGIRHIFVSGHTENHIVREGMLEQDIHFIQKPYSLETLARMVRKVFDEPGI